MRQHQGRWLAVSVAVVAAAGWVLTHGGKDSGSREPSRAGTSSVASPSSDGSAVRPDSTSTSNDPARFASQVIKHAREAGISPRLLMAILFNESDKPHDPAFERAWQKIKPDAAFGIADMHKAAFDEVKHGRSFADRHWEELPDDPDLAITAAAWYLHDLATRLPAKWSGPYTRNELLALGYNAGPGNMRAFARGARPGDIAQSYLERLRQNWAAAEQALRR
ncbi:transglycosylase SLT domain-containing protein [Actinoallomurus purpureus]|uniref:transglycosylase SLT domain-containing protein n=1 Tax=Actinoallomurus purpureus TaxID=478114 RepID=UPI002092112F|nr:transglycosylase SLT domain-containing protein [Actinoallomurus purpureus]MCO6004184.1 transglycosylase SLT domain-containing protein [Actinoallomurus purpureus]